MTHDREQLLESYLDGMLDATQRAAFERDLADDPTLRAAVERQAQLDGALRRAFDVPSFDAGRFPFVHDPSGNGQGNESVGPRESDRDVAPLPLLDRRRVGWAKYAAVAAAVLISFALVAWFVRDRRTQTEYPEMAWRSVEMVYRIETLKGFKPLWKCETDEEFAKTYKDALGTPILLPLAQLPPGTEMAGLSYSNTFSPKTVLFFGRVRGTPVIVFADRVEKDTGVGVSAESGLRVYRKPVGDLVLYEVSPLDRAYFLDSFRQEAAPRRE